MEKKFESYQLIEGQPLINQYIKAGFEPWGNAYYNHGHNGILIVSQVMVKYESEKVPMQAKVGK